jgi:hypothetical protein
MANYREFCRQLMRLAFIYLGFMAELGFLNGIHAWQRLGL